MSEITQVNITPREYVASISLMKIGKQYPFDFSEYPNLQVGDRVIVETNMLGLQMGEIKRFMSRSQLSQRNPVQRITRPATPADLLMQQQWQEREVAALIDCREKAKHMRHYSHVKFVSAEYNYNGSQLTYFFSSEEFSRVDIHPLRVAMQRQMNVRVEFRQIGAREVAKLQGGMGACGIPRCCSTFLTDFSVITISMAKAQGISLSPAELTGMCGRLRCCLSYEYEQYVEARRQLPRINKRVGTTHGEGRVVEIFPMEDAVSVRVDDEVHHIKREDLIPLQEMEALRKAAGSPCSKNEGGGCDCGSKRPRGTAQELLEEMGIETEDEDELDDDVMEVISPVSSSPAPAPRKKRRSRRGGGSGHPNEAPKAETPPATGSEGDTKSASQGGGRNRRNRHRQRRDNNQGNNDHSST